MKRDAASVCTVALVVPIAIAVVLLGVVAIGESAGQRPFGGMVAGNLAEAAGLGVAPEVIRFLARGDDPKRVYDIRPEVISSAVRKATALEAAMWSRQVELIELLERHDALSVASDRRALACLAADLGVDDVAEHLAPEGVAYCEKGKAFEQVLARTGNAQ